MKWLTKLFSKQVKSLPSDTMIKLLLDKSGDLGTRDDMAMDLSAFDLQRVEDALIKIVNDYSEEEMLIDSAGESLFVIWTRNKKKPTKESLNKMHPSARKYFE